MNLELMITQLTANAGRIRALVQGVPAEQARWKPAADAWSVLEVINHLADEERLDFRVRLEYILCRPGQIWPPIDPVGWVTARGYNQRQLEPSLADFWAARQESLAWLRNLEPPDWRTMGEAPFGQITAGDMAAAWLAHDLLHLRQLVELHWAWATIRLEPYRADYAGEW